VTLIEENLPGQATAAGAGIIQPWSSTTEGAFYELQASGAAHYAELLAQLAEIGVTEVGYRQTGALIVNADLETLDAAEHRLRGRALQSPAAGEVSKVDSSQARSLWPPLADGLHGLFVSGGARVDGRLLSAGMIAGARALGTTVIHGHASLDDQHGKVEVRCNGTLVAADTVVVAGGSWTDALLEPLGVSAGIEPQRGQISHLRLDGVDTSSWPSLSPLSDHYMVAFDDSRVVVGATRETGSGFDPRITAAGQRHVLDNALRLAPGLRDATMIETRVGLRPIPKGGLPIIGHVDGHANLYVATGFGPVGLTVAPYVGAQLAERILTGTATMDLASFQPLRETRT
jgi:D-amino-acid dehydrogenase